MTDQTLRRRFIEIAIIGLLLVVLSITQAVVDQRVEDAEHYAAGAAFNYQFAVLVKHTRELNAAAVAVLRDDLDNPCTVRVAARYAPFRPSAPLPGIPSSQRDHPQRARPGPSRYGASSQRD